MVKFLSEFVQALCRHYLSINDVKEQMPLFILDQTEERAKEKSHFFTCSYRRLFNVPSGHAFLLKSYHQDTMSGPQRLIEYYEFIQRDEDGNFVARYTLFDAEKFDRRPPLSYRMYWKFDGNNNYIRQGGDLITHCHDGRGNTYLI